MIENYLKTAWRNIAKNRFSSVINVGGLAAGMTVAILISLWIFDELSFDKYHKNYDRVAWVMQHVTNNGEVQTVPVVPYPLANELRQNYGSDFKNVAMAGGRGEHILASGNKKLTKEGVFFEPKITEMLTLKMVKGTWNGLQDPPAISARAALEKMEAVFKKFNPSQPFDYQFADEEYAQKFGNEERVGKLAGFFAVLAIFISCLGLFGMASFIAEQRTKEIGIRKVLGASVFNLWRLLSKEFVILVVLALLIGIPLAWYFMNNWLENYKYRTEISWWILAAAACGALIITILTVSFQAIKPAIANPVKSLRIE